MATEIVTIGNRDVRRGGHVGADIRGVTGNDVMHAVGRVRRHGGLAVRPDAHEAVLRNTFQTDRVEIAVANADAQMGSANRHAISRTDLGRVLRIANQADEHYSNH